MPRFKKGPEFYRLSHFGKIAYLSGIPTRYHKTKESTFTRISSSKGSDPIVVSVKKQSDCWAELKSIKALQSNAIIAVTSTPTEEACMAAAAELSMWAIKKSESECRPFEMQWVDLGNFKKFEDYIDTDKASLIVFHGMTCDSTKERFELARDLIKKTEGCCRIVCAGGITPLELASDKLRIPIDLAFYVGRKVRRLS